MKRGVEAHMITLQALFTLYQEAFFQEHPDLLGRLTDAAVQLDHSCRDGSCEEIQQAHLEMVQTIESLRVMEEMTHFDSQKEGQPLSVAMRQYMQMVMEMVLFIRSVRTGDWNLHLTALEAFTTHFFAHDKLNYARMIPLYLADMESLKITDPDIYQELLQGNWVVNKNSLVSFCAIGADHALEHINRLMKVSGGLVGITLNPNARTKFFLISPELARLAEEAQQFAGLSSAAQMHHHALSPSVLLRQEKNIEALTTTLRGFTNPFTEDCDELVNLVTKAVMPEKVKNDVCGQRAIGSRLLDEFISNRIKSGQINLWAPMKKYQLQTWKTTGKKMRVKSGDKMVELKEERNLFARMLLVSTSRPEINLEETVGRYELSVVPRSMFAADGTMLHCQVKSKLMAILEKLPTGEEQASSNDTVIHMEDSSGDKSAEVKVALVDAMAEVQSLDKPDFIKNCSQLADHFTNRILERYSQADEVRLIFDRYDVPMSLKTATRDRRQGSQPAVSYHITDTTNIAKLPMKRLLSDVKTKMELTSYLAEKMLEKAHAQEKHMVVAWGSECGATHRNMSHLQSDQEEADTKLLLHAVDATTCGASSITIHSPDTDVFVLALRRYPELCKDTNFVTGTGERRRIVPLKPIYEALGTNKAAALPAFHAISGADNTGSFAGKGKLAFWKAFQDVNDEIITALASLGTTSVPTDDTLAALEQFICKVYLPHTQISKVAKLRWWLFTKKQAQSERLPPTQDALNQAILRAHYQTTVWNDTTVNPLIPSPQTYGWKSEGGEWIPVMTTQLPAPNSVLHLVKCGCTKTRCQRASCTCRKAGFMCTDMCGCSDTGEACDNTEQLDQVHEEEEEHDYEEDDMFI